MKTKVLDYIDFEKVNTLLEGFNKSTGFVTAILDLEGNILSKSGWRQICTEFHRRNPETSKKCTISDTELAGKMSKGKKYQFYKCLNGLIDVAVPVVINGEHIANLFSGQFFFEKPDITFFKGQALKFGFDEEKYLEALEKVPVISKEKVMAAMDFLLNMTQLISEMTIQKLEQFQLNETIRKREERSRNALDNLLEGCQIIDFDWRYIYLNHTAEIHNRRPNAELIGKRYMDEWPGVEVTEVFKVIKQTLELRVPNHFENKFEFPDGSHGWFDLSIQPVPEGVFILSIDITERKKIENSLRENEEKYRLISDNSDDWIYWSAPDGHLHYISPACERVTGYSPEEFANHPELNNEIVFELDKKKVRQHSHVSKKDNNSHNIEFRIVTKSGEIRWIDHSCSPVYNDEGEYLGQRGTNRNITERKFKEKQLFESEFRFSKLYDNGPFGMVMTDKEFRFKKANHHFCTIIGYNEEELLELTFKDISHPDDLKKDVPGIQKLINKKIAVYRTEKRYFRKDGHLIWGSLTVTANYDSEGQFLYNLGIIEDITHRKQIEEDLINSKKLLAETQLMGKVGGWEFNIDTFQQTWTDEVYRIHEVDPDFNPNVNNGINFYSPASRPIIEKAVQQAIEDGEPFDLELEIITAKGNLRNVNTIGKLDPERRRVYGFFQDITERKQIEIALQRNEQRYRMLFEYSPDGIVIANPQFYYTDVNANICRMLGYTREELLCLHASDIVVASEAPRLNNELFNRVSESNYKEEWLFRRKDGSAFPAEVISTIMPDGNRMGVIRDISDRKEAEEKLKESINLMRIAGEKAKLGGWNVILGENRAYWADEVAAIHEMPAGYSPLVEEGINFYAPEWRERITKVFTDCAVNGIPYDEEMEIITASGRRIWVRTIGEAIRNEQGKIYKVHGAFQDISQRKIEEEKIREKDLQFRKLSSNVPDLIFQFTRKPDGTYNVPVASEGIRNIFGCSPEDVVDDFGPIARVIYPEDAERVIRDIEYSAQHMTYFTCEFRVQIPGKPVQWIYSRSSPEKLPDGSMTWYGFNADITYRKEAEEAIQKLNSELEKRVMDRTSQLEAANRELESFSYSVSHDLRAPLRHINGFAEILTKQYSDNLPEEARKHLNTITGAAKKMGTLIDDLLSFSRTGRAELKKSNIKMNLVVDEAIAQIKPLTGDRKIDWQISALPEIHGDFNLLRLVWINLLENAVKYTSTRENATIKIGSGNDNGSVVYYVQDNGVGFDMKYADKLFGVFQRLHAASQFDGTGIGLANAQRIILRHGGRIWAEAEPDKGAVFYFSMPK